MTCLPVLHAVWFWAPFSDIAILKGLGDIQVKDESDQEKTEPIHEKRKHIRTLLKVWVKVQHPTLGEHIELMSDNVSHGGAFILSQGVSLPDAGEEIKIQVQGMTQEAPVVRAKIIRKTDEGIAVEFIPNTAEE